MASKKKDEGVEVDPAAMAHRFEVALKAKGLTKATLAERAGVDPSMLSRLASGERLPSPSSLVKVCAQLGIGLDYLVTGRDPSGVPVSVLDLKLAQLIGDLTDADFMRFARGSNDPPTVKDALMYEFHLSRDTKRYTPSGAPEWGKIIEWVRQQGFVPETDDRPLPVAGRASRAREGMEKIDWGQDSQIISSEEPGKNRPTSSRGLTSAKPRKR